MRRINHCDQARDSGHHVSKPMNILYWNCRGFGNPNTGGDFWRHNPMLGEPMVAFIDSNSFWSSLNMEFIYANRAGLPPFFRSLEDVRILLGEEQIVSVDIMRVGVSGTLMPLRVEGIFGDIHEKITWLEKLLSVEHYWSGLDERFEEARRVYWMRLYSLKKLCRILRWDHSRSIARIISFNRFARFEEVKKRVQLDHCPYHGFRVPFRLLWDFIHSDVVDAVRSFFHSSYSPGSQFKFHGAPSKSSRCGLSGQVSSYHAGKLPFKVVSKILAYRPVASNCFDNRLVSSGEIFDLYSRLWSTTWKVLVECGFENDIRKAFDSMSWDFLLAVLDRGLFWLLSRGCKVIRYLLCLAFKIFSGFIPDGLEFSPISPRNFSLQLTFFTQTMCLCYVEDLSNLRCFDLIRLYSLSSLSTWTNLISILQVGLEVDEQGFLRFSVLFLGNFVIGLLETVVSFRGDLDHWGSPKICLENFHSSRFGARGVFRGDSYRGCRIDWMHRFGGFYVREGYEASRLSLQFMDYAIVSALSTIREANAIEEVRCTTSVIRWCGGGSGPGCDGYFVTVGDSSGSFVVPLDSCYAFESELLGLLLFIECL
ncbi:hypothetical protein FNV43_RR26905 [Rhamnella rubrinervis]|uniref:Uncharacterized protein n=1 Tax=Rhamnella rubrinervis TaxID=2594499 RepID=A0A8K0DNX0_9ROSA|nr:hypothetical protein FNV43_RR26905 [Rhamnella rubrinervis]